MPYTQPYYPARPQRFQAESSKPLPFPFPPLPPSVSPRVRSSEAAADRHRQPTARGVPAGTLLAGASCVFLPFCACVASSCLSPLFPFPYLPPLSSQAKPNMLPNPRKRNPPPLVPKFTSVGIPFFSQSRPVDQPHMYVLVMFVQIRNNTFHWHRREGEGALDFLLSRGFWFPGMVVNRRTVSPCPTFRPPSAQAAQCDCAFRSLLVGRASGKGSHGVRDSLREARHVGDVSQSRVAGHRAAQAQEDVLKAALEQRHDLGCNFADLSLLDVENG